VKHYIVDTVEIPFDPDWQNIAISVSGGADSALLAYLVCSKIRELELQIKVHIISHVRMWKTRPWQRHNADAVFNWLFQEFYHITFVRHTNFIAPEIEYGNIGASLTDEYGKKVSGDNIQQRAYAEYICFQENVDAYYNAVTRNPRGVDFVGMTERDIEPSNDNKHLALMRHMDKWVCHPFRFIEKSWVVKQYKQLKIESLFDITRSCEGDFEHINYQSFTPGQYVPVCGKCFWCKERAWAIECQD
jgi:hypothetical protein